MRLRSALCSDRHSDTLTLRHRRRPVLHRCRRRAPPAARPGGRTAEKAGQHPYRRECHEDVCPVDGQRQCRLPLGRCRPHRRLCPRKRHESAGTHLDMAQRARRIFQRRERQRPRLGCSLPPHRSLYARRTHPLRQHRLLLGRRERGHRRAATAKGASTVKTRRGTASAEPITLPGLSARPIAYAPT